MILACLYVLPPVEHPDGDSGGTGVADGLLELGYLRVRKLPQPRLGLDLQLVRDSVGEADVDALDILQGYGDPLVTIKVSAGQTDDGPELSWQIILTPVLR